MWLMTIVINSNSGKIFSSDVLRLGDAVNGWKEELRDYPQEWSFQNSLMPIQLCPFWCAGILYSETGNFLQFLCLSRIHRHDLWRCQFYGYHLPTWYYADEAWRMRFQYHDHKKHNFGLNRWDYILIITQKRNKNKRRISYQECVDGGAIVYRWSYNSAWTLSMLTYSMLQLHQKIVRATLTCHLTYMPIALKPAV